MTRTAVIGAALALLMTSTAFAQTASPPAPGEPVTPPALGNEAPAEDVMSAPGPDDAMSPAPMDDDEARDDARERRSDGDRRGWRERRGDIERPGWRDRRGRHAGGRGGRDSEGAFFRFRGADGQTIAIKCATRDSTEECVEAIMPMLDRMLPGDPAPAGN